ncbi:hypothetical protein [Planctomonas psychrotolerans]|uniref:hypothetical protein n=1 Tax=Planctomonas psychrotolerans TaxID=2528712 RepID=UPI00123BBB5E|nr:hypothetical protein [Planctomonas psychrotolerans]
MMRSRSTEKAAVVGGEPRISLLPPEVAQARKGKALRRALLGVVMVALLAVGGGVAWATVDATSAEQALLREQARTEELLAEQGKYVEVRVIADRVRTTEAARMVGASTEIDWTEYLGELNATLPAGSSITELTVDSATPLEAYAQATAPLQPQRVATITATAQVPDLADVPKWLDALRDLPGFADATPNTVSTTGTGGGYTVELTLHVDSRAYANRFSTEDSE